jgi:ComF family protein
MTDPLRVRWARKLAQAAGELRAALYPELCWLCRARPTADGLGCAEHALAPSRLDPAEPRCPGCAERLPVGLAQGLCARCRREPRGFRRLLAGGAYDAGALREWVLALKHGGRAELAAPLAHFLASAVLEAGLGRGAVLVPVPLHRLRRLERGYDQAHLLGAALAEPLGLECVRALRRVRWTAPQGAPGAVSRAANVEGAFEARQRVAGREVWLVDDVVTSGATARACAAALRRAGAREVSVLALARVDPRHARSEEETGAGRSAGGDSDA